MRIFSPHGPRTRPDDGRAIPAFVTQALSGRPLTVVGDVSQTRSVCYVDDTGRGIVALALGDHPGPVNIGNPDELTILERAERIRAITGSASPIEHVPLPVDDPRVRRPDTTLAREVLGWAPEVPTEEGLRRTVAWFADQLAALGALAGADELAVSEPRAAAPG